MFRPIRLMNAAQNAANSFKVSLLLFQVLQILLEFRRFSVVGQQQTATICNRFVGLVRSSALPVLFGFLTAKSADVTSNQTSWATCVRAYRTTLLVNMAANWCELAATARNTLGRSLKMPTLYTHTCMMAAFLLVGAVWLFCTVALLFRASSCVYGGACLRALQLCVCSKHQTPCNLLCLFANPCIFIAQCILARLTRLNANPSSFSLCQYRYADFYLSLSHLALFHCPLGAIHSLCCRCVRRASRRHVCLLGVHEPVQGPGVPAALSPHAAAGCSRHVGCPGALCKRETAGWCCCYLLLLSIASFEYQRFLH